MHIPPFNDGLFSKTNGIITSGAWRNWHLYVHRMLISLSGGVGGVIVPSATVVSETSYGQAASAGSAATYSRGDHTHGTPIATSVSGPPLTVAGNIITFNFDTVTLGVSGNDLYVKNDSHTHDTQYLKLDGSNANVTINIGAEDLITTGDITCNNLISSAVKPPGDSVTAIQLQNAAGANILNVDSNNNRIGINTAAPSDDLDVTGNINLSGDIKIGTVTVLSVVGTGNLFVGEEVSAAGNYNTVCGEQAGYNLAAGGNYNSYFGYRAGLSNTTGDNNTGVGSGALYINNNSANTAVGYNALTSCNATGNTAVGANAGDSVTSGQRNALFGWNAGQAISTSDYNSIFGAWAGYYNTGANNSIFGYQAGYVNLIGTDNLYLGYKSGYYQENGSYNVFIGSCAGEGNLAAYSTSYAVAIGRLAFGRGSVGTHIVAIGDSALYYNAGSGVVGIGSSSGYSNTGDYSVYIGVESGLYQGSGDNNVIIGAFAGKGTISYNATGNVFLGYSAGFNESGSNKLYIENSNSASPLIYGEFDNNFIQINADTALTNTLQTILKLKHITSGLAAAGLGLGINFELEDDGSNNNVAGILECLWLNAADGAEAADFVFKLMDGGVAAAEKARLSSAGNFTVAGYLEAANYVDSGNYYKIAGNTLISIDGTNNLIIGIDADPNTTSNSILIGARTCFDGTLTGNWNIFFGYESGYYATSGSSNLFFGTRAGYGVTAAYGNTGVGTNTCFYLEGGHSFVAIGNTACQGGTWYTAIGTVGIGVAAFYNITDDNDYQVGVGYHAGYYLRGENNVVVGAYSSKGVANYSADGRVTIGYAAGENDTNSDVLFIENSNSATPLIWGDFANDLLTTYADFTVKDVGFTKCNGFVTRQPEEVQTTDAVQATLDSITLLDENTYHCTAFVAGVKADGSDRASYHIECTVYRTGAGNATLQGAVTTIHSQESDANWDATFTVNGNDLRVSVTGIAATTIEWSGVLQYINISN